MIQVIQSEEFKKTKNFCPKMIFSLKKNTNIQFLTEKKNEKFSILKIQNCSKNFIFLSISSMSDSIVFDTALVIFCCCDDDEDDGNDNVSRT